MYFVLGILVIAVISLRAIGRRVERVEELRGDLRRPVSWLYGGLRGAVRALLVCLDLCSDGSHCGG